MSHLRREKVTARTPVLVTLKLKEELPDLRRPAEYRVIRMRLDRAITDHFDLQPNAFHHPLVKQADAIALRAEAEVLKVSRGSSIRWHRPPYPCDGWANYTASVEMASTFVEVEQEFLAAAGTFSGVLA